jgi:hypothetical protein
MKSRRRIRCLVRADPASVRVSRSCQVLIPVQLSSDCDGPHSNWEAAKGGIAAPIRAIGGAPIGSPEFCRDRYWDGFGGSKHRY